MSEQGRAGQGGKSPTLSGDPIGVSGAEQDRWAGHFSGMKLPSASDISDKLPKSSGAEQDRYERWFGKKPFPLEKLNEKLPRTSGAEQDRFGSHFGERSPPAQRVNATAVGLLQHAVLPAFGFHTGLSVVAYGLSRYVDRIEGKDWLWPAGMTANAWWSAIGSRVYHEGLTIPEAWSDLGYTEMLLLMGVSAWGVRLFYQMASRSIRRGRDDPRYDTAKKDPDFWNKAFVGMFLPEAVAQTLVSLPFTFAFRVGAESPFAATQMGSYPIFHDIAIFLFSSGFALEVLADAQLEAHREHHGHAVNREGVWSIVRHPNYLGDALIHASFPLLLLGSGLLHPIAVLGPCFNYIFLRLIGHEREIEAAKDARPESKTQQEFKEYKSEKNSFWPALDEIKNKWTWTCVAAGVAGVLLERGVRTLVYG